MRALFQNLTKKLVANYLLNLDSQLSGGAQTQHLGLPHGGVNGLEQKNCARYYFFGEVLRILPAG